MSSLRRPSHAWLREAYEELGLSSTLIGRVIGCSRTWALKLLREAGVEVSAGGASGPRFNRHAIPSRSELWALHHEQGLSLSQLAARYDVTPKTVVLWMLEREVPVLYPEHEEPAEEKPSREQLVRLYHDERLSTADIAERLDRVVSRINALFKEYTIARRREHRVLERMEGDVPALRVLLEPSGLVVTLDEEDWERVRERRWYLDKGRPVCRRKGSESRRVLRLNRLLLDEPAGQISHINDDLLDCRRVNLSVSGEAVDGVITTQSGPVTAEELWVCYWSELMSVNDIAREYGVTFSAVRKWLEKLGIPLRDKQQRRLAERGIYADVGDGDEG